MYLCRVSLVETIINRSGAPQEGLIDWDSFRQALGDDIIRLEKHPHFPHLLRLFGNSRFLTRFLISHPPTVFEVLDSPFLAREKTFEDFLFDLQAIDSDDPMEVIRFYKYQEYLRISLKDLNGADQELIYREISHLALAILQQVDALLLQKQIEEIGPPLYKSTPQKQSSHHVLTMGKFGGRELNYSSDIDLISIHDQDEDLQDINLNSHEYFVRHLRRLTEVLQTRSPTGFLYRVDWDLRPEGKAGTLINSLSAMESYYENFGADWERQALSKANLGSGDLALGERFLNFIQPFVYRRYLDWKALHQIAHIKDRIYEDQKKAAEKGFNVKLGRGGIREIEFYVQAYLMVFGGKNPKLRSRNTLQTLQNLKEAQHLSASVAKELYDAYLFLRKLEHRLQMVEEAQTHLLHNDAASLLPTARRMGFDHESSQKALDLFQEKLAQTTASVHRIFTALFEDSKIFATSDVSDQSDRSDLSDLSALEKVLEQRLAQETAYEQKLNIIRLFKKEELEKISTLERAPKPPSRLKILARLSAVAEAICRQALKLAINELKPVYGLALSEGDPQNGEANIVIVGLGKLGGREINYYSDLDVIFLFSEHGETSGPQKIENSFYFSKLAQKFISILSVPTACGVAYPVDTELRPSGNFGPLVTTVEGFMDYQRQTSQIWEKQALLRARPIAGPPHLSHLIESHIHSLVYSKPFPPEIKKEMARLRKRVEDELAHENEKFFDFKWGLGGLMDIEFILQYFQLVLGATHPELRTTNTFEGLDHVIAMKVGLKPGDGVLLKEACFFYRDLESRLGLILGKSTHRFEFSDKIFEKITAEMNLATPFESLYRTYRTRVREIFLKIFNDPAV